MAVYYTLLLDRSLIRLSGEDTLPFLQGVVSNDVMRLPDRKIVYAALLTPQGKYLHDFFLVHNNEGVLMDGEQARSDDLSKRLGMYKLRSKVLITPPDVNHGVVAIWGDEKVIPVLANVEDAVICKDPRLPALGWRIYGKVETIMHYCQQQEWYQVTATDYDAMRLALGVPDGSRDMMVDKSFLLECHFEALHGVDFNKGCYIGQEVTARSKFRGQVRKLLYQVRTHEGELPESGTLVYCNDAVIGELRSHMDSQGLAILRIDDVMAAQKEKRPITANDKMLDIFLPEWIKMNVQ